MYNQLPSVSPLNFFFTENLNMNWFFNSFTWILLIFLSVITGLYMYNRENEASLAVLPDLFVELDSMDEVCWNNITIL